MTLNKLTLRLLPLGLALSAYGATAQAPGDVRIALVIGNSAYTGAPALLNPANDAKAMSDALRGLGFTVIELRDGNKAQMAAAIIAVRDALKGKQGVGMLYYAGHGLQVDEHNFMVPVDARMSKAGDVAAQTVDVSGVVDAFKTAGNRMNILVLDACRDNPFGGITTGKGLAPLDAPSGTFFAYATAPGNVAEDGDAKSGNGLYTQYLLQELKKPQASIESVFKRVRFAVRKASSGRQIPWESTSLEDDFQFNDGKIRVLPKPTAQQLQAEFSQEKPDWDRIKDSSTADDFYAFLQKYPNGTITEAAHARLNALASPTIMVQGAGPSGKAQAYALSKHRLGDTYENRATHSTSGGVIETTEKVIRMSDREIAVESLTTIPGMAKPASSVKYFDPQGGFLGLKDVFTNSPPTYLAPSGLLQVGASWKESSQMTWLRPNMPSLPPSTSYSRITARETVTVPAGTFDAFRVEINQVYPPGGLIQRNLCTFWVSPDIPLPIKNQCRQEASGPPTISTGELLRFTRGS